MLNYKYLRPTKAVCAAILAEGFTDRTASLGIRHLSNVRIRKLGQVSDPAPSPRLIADDCDFYAEIADNDCKTSTRISGISLYAGFLRKSWGHFLMNSTARLWPLFMTGYKEYDHIVFFSEEASESLPEGNFRELLRLAGILPRCIVLSAGVTEFESLDIPELSLTLEGHWSREFFLTFSHVREAALAEISDIPHTKGLILARSAWNARNRMQINIEALEDLFVSNGYTRISPERLSLSELIAALEGADEIVSPSGSTAHNFLFAEGKRLVTLERCAANNMYQTAISLDDRHSSIPVDCFWQPMPVLSTDNLTIYGLTPELQQFATDRGFREVPDTRFTGLAPIREFRQFLKIYRRHYGYGCPLHAYESAQFPAIAEACLQSRARYARYLDRRIPIQWADYLSPRVWKRYIHDKIHGMR